MVSVDDTLTVDDHIEFNLDQDPNLERGVSVAPTKMLTPIGATTNK